MTNQEYQEMLDAMEETRKWLLSDKEAAKKWLQELGIWHLLVPKKSTKPSRPSARKK